MAVEISCDTARGSRHTRAMRIDAGRLLKVLALERIELSILLTSDQHIHELNHRYRHKNRPTDVLSFPQLGSGEFDKRDGAAVSGALLGDVVISIDTAVRQAQETGIGVAARLRALLVHGVLHLLGYDHERSAAEATRMAARESDLLNALGSRPVLNAAR